MCSWLTYLEINGGRKEKISIYEAEQDEHGEKGWSKMVNPSFALPLIPLQEWCIVPAES